MFAYGSALGGADLSQHANDGQARVTKWGAPHTAVSVKTEPTINYRQRRRRIRVSVMAFLPKPPHVAEL